MSVLFPRHFSRSNVTPEQEQVQQMGGTTITVYGVTEEEVLEKLTEQISEGAKLGLYPDSSAVIISGDALASKEPYKQPAKLFNFNDEGDYIEVEEGRVFHVGVAARFSKPPEPGQLLGTIHLHT